MSFLPDFLVFHLPSVMQGAVTTLQLGMLSFGLSLLMGIVWAMMRLYAPPVLAKAAQGLALFFRGMPELLIILAVYYLHGPILEVLTWGRISQLSPFAAGVLALSLCYGAYASEVIRYAIITIPPQQIEAAEAFALSTQRRFLRIVLPQATFRSLKGLTNLLLSLLKDTALLSVISVSELMRMTNLSIASAKHPFTFYMIAACLYLMMTFVVLFIVRVLDRVYFYRFMNEERP
ncbi:MAG: amino acid ABC transporter permease [Alphaproteobacteria bacterium]